MAELATARWPVPALVAWARDARFLGEGGVRQRRATDCGPAALTEALRCLGMDVPYPDPEGGIALGPRGCGLDDLERAAARRGAVARMRRLDPPELDGVRAPAVLHLREGHFVVFEGRGPSGGVLIVDPSLGRLEQSSRNLARHWSGWVLELSLPERRNP
ncbi:MAG: cysteine peptidase family C39 domain-containing protein [bacterium]